MALVSQLDDPEFFTCQRTEKFTLGDTELLFSGNCESIVQAYGVAGFPLLVEIEVAVGE